MASFTATGNANLFFCNNYCTHKHGGGAVHALGPIKFAQNQDVLFYNNTTAGAQYTGTGDSWSEQNRGGAIYSTIADASPLSTTYPETAEELSVPTIE